MIILIFGALLLGVTNAEVIVAFNETEIEVHMDNEGFIPFTIENLSSDVRKVNITAVSSHWDIVQVHATAFDPSSISNGVYKGMVNATGIFLGSSQVSLSVSIEDGVSIKIVFLAEFWNSGIGLYLISYVHFTGMDRIKYNKCYCN